MKTFAASLLALGLLAGVAHAKSPRDVFSDMADAAPRGIFDELKDAQPRSVFDDLRDQAPRSIFDDLRDSAPRAKGFFRMLRENGP